MYKRPVPDEVFQEICRGMQEAEQSGELSGLFKGECREPRELPSASKLLHSIRPGIKLYKSFFLKIFGYDITTPGFAEDAISRLEILGSTKARGHYAACVQEYETKHDAEMEEVAHWFKLECEKQWEKKRKEGEEKRKQRERKQTSRKWMEGLY